jgi:hypothetical protein
MPLQISISNAIGSRGVTAAGGFDPDAQAFITAASITDPIQQSAINQLVVDLKGYSIWSKFSALYPFVGGTASTHKFNLKNPLDTNAAFRLVFNGGGTHSANGYQTNGVNAFAETYYNPFVNLSNINSNHISIYSRTNNQGGIDMGGGVGSVLVDLELNYASTSYNWNMASNFSHTNNNSTGLYINTRTASNAFKLIKNGSTVLGSSTGSAGATKPNITYHIGKRNYDPLWTNRQYAFASIGDGLTDTEAANFYTAVQTFQTTLGRSIGTQTVSDADAQAFVTAADIQDQVEATAVNNLTIGLKADGLWTKFSALYPFVGGTASTHKFNLKNPLDTDAAFRLVFNGGWTHSSTGATPNGTNAYANTFYTPSLHLTDVNSNHISYYSRTNAGSAIEMGGGPVPLVDLVLKGNESMWNMASFQYYPPQADTRYFLINSRTSANLFKFIKNGVVNTTSTNSAGTTKPNLPYYIGARNYNGAGNYSTKQCAFASIGDGLTDTEATNLNSRVTTFQTALNRNI